MSDSITLEGKLLFPSDYVGAVDLAGRDTVVTIDHVEVAELRLQGGKSQAKPIVFFVGKKKKLVLNKTNARTIAALYGGKVEGWTGKRVILYPTTTQCGRSRVDCIRIREHSPDRKQEEPQPLNDSPDWPEDTSGAAEQAMTAEQ